MLCLKSRGYVYCKPVSGSNLLNINEITYFEELEFAVLMMKVSVQFAKGPDFSPWVYTIQTILLPQSLTCTRQVSVAYSQLHD